MLSRRSFLLGSAAACGLAGAGFASESSDDLKDLVRRCLGIVDAQPVEALNRIAWLPGRAILIDDKGFVEVEQV